jgi:hypothetical protein
MRRFAEDTSVPVAKSRGEIDRLLREWGARGLQWTDDWEHGRIALKFLWRAQDGKDYMARFAVALPTDEALREEARHGGRGKFLAAKFQRLADGRGRQEHRLLALWLKAALNAVAAGIVGAETLFLPFLEDRHGQTVAEIALPRLGRLLEGGASRLLGDGRASPTVAEG